MKPARIALIAGLGLAVAAPWVLAQDQMTDAEQRDWFVGFVEGQLSTPDRQIRISNIDGALSEQASIREITISDKEGVWLRVNNASIDWNQGALFTGRLLVRSLAAESIEYIRNAVPSGDPDLPAPEAAPLAVPEFPVAIQLDSLSVPKITFGESVFGLGSAISLGGSLTLEGGSLTTALDITRLDGPGGTLDADVAYKAADQTVAIDVTLTEPPNGILANLANIEGKPEIALNVKGEGPVADLRATLTLDAGGRRALEGQAVLLQSAEGLAVDADLGGPIAELVAPPYRDFFGARTSLAARALVRSQGGIDISAFRLSGGQLSLEGSGATTSDGFLSRLALTAAMRDPAGGRVLLPVAGAATSIKDAVLDVDFGGAGDDGWTAHLALGAFDNGDIAAKAITLDASGVAANLADPATRRVTFNADGVLDGIASPDPAVAEALGESAGFGLAGLWAAGGPIELAQLRVLGKALEARLAGTIDDFVFDGDVALRTSSIAPFSGVAGRELGGALSLTAKGTVSPLIGGFNLTLSGTADDLALAEPALDRVLAGRVELSGRVARTTEGLEAEGFRLGNDKVQIAADGTYATGAADFVFSAVLSDLGLVADGSSGRLSVTGSAKGSEAIALVARAELPSGRLAGKPVSNAAFGFTGALAADGALAGKLDGDGFLDSLRVALAGDVASDKDSRRLTDLRFEAGPTVLTGNVTQDAAGLLTGRLDLASPNLSAAAALFTLEAKGSANAAIELGHVGGRQDASVAGSIAGLVLDTVRVGSADFRGTVIDLFGVPGIDGTISGKDIAAGGVTLATLEARASRSGADTAFEGNARLSNGATAALAGTLAPLDDGYRLGLERVVLTQGALEARLARPTVLAIAGDRVQLADVRFDVGRGSITASGSAGEVLDIAIGIEALPLSIANAVAPGLGLGGSIEGNGRVTGKASAPQATFSLSGSGIEAAMIEGYGIAPLRFVARGSYAGNAVSLERLTASGAGGLELSASGRVPLAGGGLDIAVDGSAPLALGNRFVAARGGQLSGTATLRARVAGSLSDPRITGTVSTAGSGYIDPELNLRLVDITGSANLAGDSIAIERLSAGLATGGTVSVSGSVGLSGGNPVDISVSLNSARYADGNLFVATASGQLALRGRLAASPTLSGNVVIEKADITVPDSFGGSAALIEAEHRNAPAPVLATLKRATVDAGGAPIPQSRPSVIQLDVTVSAPNQIFVRGRGLDAELGGSLRLTGPVNDIQPVGGFQLRRGRLAILGQRITFEEGSVTLVGNLDPYLDFVARTEGDDVTVYVTVTGRVSDLAIGFSSRPALPEDEVLSRLIFRRSMSELSPLQLAKLAGAAAELAGGSNSSLVDSLRAKAGLADLDVVTGDDGNLAVQAGAYLQDNIYLGVQAGADGSSRVTVNLDLTDQIRAKASTGTNGDSSVGIFYETDY